MYRQRPLTNVNNMWYPKPTLDNEHSPQPRETEVETALTVIEPTTTLSPIFEDELKLAHDFIRASRSPNTLDAYVSDWRIFAEWCGVRKLETLPPTPDTLCMFLADEASRGRRPSTLQRRLAAIKYALEAAGVLGDTERSPTSHKSVTATLGGATSRPTASRLSRPPCRRCWRGGDERLGQASRHGPPSHAGSKALAGAIDVGGQYPVQWLVSAVAVAAIGDACSEKRLELNRASC
jgi:Phage integrase, N-terminal SAM-like domain